MHPSTASLQQMEEALEGKGFARCNKGYPVNRIYLSDISPATFVNYVEGIYVGYRWYETAAVEGAVNYDTAVQYPFGYGLSCTSIDQKMGNLSESNGTVSFDVTVTNTGSVAGKDVVEVYCNPPYTNGGIEKSAVNPNVVAVMSAGSAVEMPWLPKCKALRDTVRNLVTTIVTGGVAMIIIFAVDNKIFAPDFGKK